MAHGLAPVQEENAPVGRDGAGNGRVGHFGWKAQTASLFRLLRRPPCANVFGLAKSRSRSTQTDGASPTIASHDRDTTYSRTVQPAHRVCAPLPRPVVKPSDVAGSTRPSRQTVIHHRRRAAAHARRGRGLRFYSDLLLQSHGQLARRRRLYGELLAPNRIFLARSWPMNGALRRCGAWRTPAPYMHDGRAASLEDAIRLHGGQAAAGGSTFRPTVAK